MDVFGAVFYNWDVILHISICISPVDLGCYFLRCGVVFLLQMDVSQDEGPEKTVTCILTSQSTKSLLCNTYLYIYIYMLHIYIYVYLGGGFKYFLCSSLFGEMIQFD